MEQAVITIVPFKEADKNFIRQLNYEWLEKYFEVEPTDVEQLGDPQTYIIDKGGHIFYAKYKDEFVGTSSLMLVEPEIFELAKMAVTEKYKGYGIGKLLLEHCIDEAKKLHAKKLILFSNTRLTAAIHLYKKYGFNAVPLPAGVHYKRADIMMEKSL